MVAGGLEIYFGGLDIYFILVAGTNGCLDISRHTICWMWIGAMRPFSLEWHYYVFEDGGNSVIF